MPELLLSFSAGELAKLIGKPVITDAPRSGDFEKVATNAETAIGIQLKALEAIVGKTLSG